MKARIILLGVLLAFAPTSAAEERGQARTPQFEAALDQLVELQGGREMVRDMFDRMSKAQIEEMEKRFMTGVRERLVFEARMRAVAGRMERDWEYFLAPTRDAYGQAFTHEEIKELIAFYETPLGQKLTEFVPKLMEEFPKILTPWLMRVMGELMMKMREEFPELQPATGAPPPETQERND